MSTNYDDIVAAASGPKVGPPTRRRSNYDDIIDRHAARTGLDPQLVRAVIGQESGGNPQARSPKGAGGLMQLMPATAARFGVRDINDPEENIRGGTDYLSFLQKRFKGDLDKTLAAYNAGEGAVDRFGGIPPYRETQNYVPQVKSRMGARRTEQPPQQEENPYDAIINAASTPAPPTTDPLAEMTAVSQQARQAGQAGQPPARRSQFETSLTPEEEQRFQQWKQTYAPNDSGADYDLRGAFKAGLSPDSVTGHWPDKFKKPNHPTFSNESQYATGDYAARAGHWEGDKFVPPAAPRPVTPYDAAWHLGMTPEQGQSLTRRQARVLAEAVAEDERKRAAGETIGEPTIEYQNEMRKRAGMAPLKYNVTTQPLQIGSIRLNVPFTEKARAPYFRPDTAPAPLPVLEPRKIVTRTEKPFSLEGDQSENELRRRLVANPNLYSGEEYQNFLRLNRSLDSPQQRQAFVDLKLKQQIAPAGSARNILVGEQVEQGRQQRVAKMNWPEYLAQIPKSAALGVTDSFATLLKSIAVGAKDLDKTLGTESYKGKETTDLATYQLGEYIQREARTMVRSNPDLEQEILVGQSPQTLGQVATFVLGGWASKAPKLATTILGIGMTTGDAYDEVRAAGGTDEQAVKAGLVAGALLGPTELIGMNGAMHAITDSAAKQTWRLALKQALKEGSRDIVENVLQEMGQEWGQGEITGKRRTGKEVAMAGLQGAVGGGVTVPLSVIANRPIKEARPLEPSPDVVDKASETPITLPEDGKRPLAPESPETIHAQMDALLNGRGNRYGVLIPKGQSAPTKIPKGFMTTRTDEGVVIHPKELSSADVRELVNSGDSWRLLGHTNPDTPDATRVVIARAGIEGAGGIKPGVELLSSYVVPGQEQNMVEEMRSQFAPYQPYFEIGGQETAAKAVTARSDELVDTQGAKRGDGDAAIVESAGNRALVDTKDLSDLTQTRAFRDHGLRGLDVPSQRLVMERVLAALHNPEVRDRVIETIPVDMVNNLLRAESPSQVELHDEAVLQDLAAPGNASHAIPVSIDSADALVRRVAEVTAKVVTPGVELSGRLATEKPAGIAGEANAIGNEGVLAGAVTEEPGIPSDLGRPAAESSATVSTGDVGHEANISQRESQTNTPPHHSQLQKRRRRGARRGQFAPGKVEAPTVTTEAGATAAEQATNTITAEEEKHWRSQMEPKELAQWDASQKFLKSRKAQRLLGEIENGQATKKTLRQLKELGRGYGLEDDVINEHIRLAQGAPESTTEGSGAVSDTASEAAATEGRSLTGEYVDESGTLRDASGAPLFARKESPNQIRARLDKEEDQIHAKFQSEMAAERGGPVVQPKTVEEAGQRYRTLASRMIYLNGRIGDAGRLGLSQSDVEALWKQHNSTLQEAQNLETYISDRGYKVNMLGQVARQGETFPDIEKQKPPFKRIRDFFRPYFAMAPKGWETAEPKGEFQPQFSVDQNRVKLENEEASRLLDKAYQLMGMKKRGETGIAGVFEDNPERLVRQLETMEYAGAPELAAAVREAAKAGQGKVLLAFGERSMTHERFHESSAAANRYLQDRHGGFEQFENDPTFQLIRTALTENMHYPDKTATLVEEGAAYIAAGDYQRLGISRKQAINFLQKWFESFIAHNGEVSVERFQEMAEDGQAALQKALEGRKKAAGKRADESLPGVPEGRESGTGEGRAPPTEPTQRAETTVKLKDGREVQIEYERDPNKWHSGRIEIHAYFGPQKEYVGGVTFEDQGDKTAKATSFFVNKKWQRLGVGTALYDFAEAQGYEPRPNTGNRLSGQGAKFWEARRRRKSPETLFSRRPKDIEERRPKDALARLEELARKRGQQLRAAPVPAPSRTAKPATTEAKPELKIVPPPQRRTEAQKAERSFPKSAEAAGYRGGTDRDYSILTNPESLQKAQREITRVGADRAAVDLAHAENVGAPEIATGILLMQHYEKNGDIKRAVDVAGDVARKLTQAGQTVQAASIISRLSPEGVLLHAQKILKGTGKELSEETGQLLITQARAVSDAEKLIAEIQKQRPDIFGPNGEILPRPRESRANAPRTARTRIGTLQDRLVTLEQQARERMQARAATAKTETATLPAKGQRGAGINPVTAAADLGDLVIIGAAKLARKGMTQTVWLAEMAREASALTKKDLRRLYRESYERYQAERQQFLRESRMRGAERQARGERGKLEGPPTPAELREQGPLSPQEYNRIIAERAEAQKLAQRSYRELARTYQNLNRGRLQVIADTAVGLRRANLLTAVKTHLRNITSNIGFTIVSEETARPMAALADMVVRRTKGTGLRTTAGLSIPKASQALYAAAVKEGPRRAVDIILGREVLPLEGYRSGMESIGSKMQLNEADSGFKILDTYINTVFRSLEAEDAVFKVYAFRRELADIALSQARSEKASGADIRISQRARELQANPTDAMQMEAATYADYATFQNKNVVSSGISAFKRFTEPVGGKFLVEQIAPFDRTPTNIIARALENSPLGLISAARKYKRIGTQAKTAADAIAGAAFTRQEQKDFARTFGRASTGTMLAALAMILAAKGLLSGAADYDTDREEYMKKRRQFGGGGMLRIPGTNQRVSIIDTPVGKSMATAASIYEQMKDSDNTWGEAVTKSGRAALNTYLLDQPLIRGLRDLGETKSVGEAAAQYGTTFVPGSQALKSISEVADSQPRLYRGQGPAAQFRTLLPGRYGRGGLPVDSGVDVGERGGVGRRALRALDPFNTTTEGHGPRKRSESAGEGGWPLQKDLDRLDITINAPQRIKPGKNQSFKAESDEEYEARRQKEAEAIKVALGRLEQMNFYKGLPDRSKEAAIRGTITAARESVRYQQPAKQREQRSTITP